VIGRGTAAPGQTRAETPDGISVNVINWSNHSFAYMVSAQIHAIGSTLKPIVFSSSVQDRIQNALQRNFRHDILPGIQFAE
jgi:hypothetical protein